jgi:hypothetical protein
LNWRSARPWANRRAAESRHYNGCVIIAGAQLRNLCAFHRFVLDVTVERTAKSAERVLSVAVHPDGPSQGGLPALPRFTGMHARDCAPTAADGISPRPSFAWPSPKNVWFFTAANTVDDDRFAADARRLEPLHIVDDRATRIGDDPHGCAGGRNRNRGGSNADKHQADVAHVHILSLIGRQHSCLRACKSSRTAAAQTSA